MFRLPSRAVPPVEIRPVKSRREVTAFIKLPFRLYRDAPLWVPPLIFERRQFLDRAKNPFFEHGRAEYFLAWRDGRAVGRITAQVDDNFQAFQDNKWGQFGFFECEDDPEAAKALIDTADGWLTAQGCDRMVGPCNFTTNDECGVLVEGFDRPPLILSDWTHEYYPALLESTGVTKAMDLLMWELRIQGKEHVHQAIWDIAAQVEAKHGITCRYMRKKDLDSEISRFMEVYNAAWERNWGFVPLTEHEVRHYAKQLRPILDENWAMVAEHDGRDRRRRADAARLQLRAQGGRRPAAAVRLGASAARAQADRPRARVRAGRQARVPAHRHRRAAV